jgi:pyrroline-5-carboxylate reductase
MSSSIVLVGFGNMGRALAEGWLADGREPPSVTVVDPSDSAREAASALGLRVGDAGTAADVVVFAVKPDQLDDAVAGLQYAADTVYLSIAAGRKISGIAAHLGADAAIVRAMPNTPAAIGQGMIVLCASASVTRRQRTVCESLMRAVGHVEWVDDEALMDAVTAVSGSGPAYVFLLIECLAAAGRRLGLAPALAERLATETVAGAGIYARSADVDAAELRRRVTSPNGTTQAALEVLMDEHGLEALLREAVAAAARRSRELAGEQ